jgi:superoxide dismutase, Cu-Zn family
MRRVLVTALVASALGFGCGDEGEDDGHEGEVAMATLAAKSGNTTLAGTAEFVAMPGGVSLQLMVTGAPPGVHGVHIHETGNCDAPDAMSAGAHWNPSMQMHGAPGATAHLGDLGNMTVAADGTGMIATTNTAWQVATGSPMDVIGKAVVVHGMPDDLVMQPAGNAGPRIGCGVIVAHAH